MSNYQILPRLYGGLVGHDAVFWYTYAEQTGTDGTQTADYHRVFQSGDEIAFEVEQCGRDAQALAT